MNIKNDSKEPTWLVTVAIVGYLLSYILTYVRYTYFAGSEIMRFPTDMLAMTPPCNDLYVSSKYAIQTLHAGTIKGVPFVYSPLFVILYSPLSLFNFNTLRWLSFISIIISYSVIGFIFPKFWKGNALTSPIALLILFTGFLSYAMRFELERGQWNVQSLLLCFAGLALKDSKNSWIIFISYILFSISVHLKLYPLLFTIGYIIPEDGWKANIKRLVTLGLLNILLLLAMGKTFLREYFITLTHSAGTPSIWISNISLYAYTAQVSGYMHVSIDNLKLLNDLYIFFFVGTLSIAMYKGIRGDNSIILFLITIGATLFPTVSFDYKIILTTLCASFFFSTYKVMSTKALIVKNSHGVKTSIAFSLNTLTEYVALSTIVLVYPYTLYSYVYKADWGILGASNTTPLIIISFALMLLIVIYPSRKNHT
jgi:hypothetical protein